MPSYRKESPPMRINYEASRSDVYAAMNAMDDKTLRGVSSQLLADLKRKNRLFITLNVGAVLLTLTVSLAMLLLFNDRFPREYAFSYWGFHLTTGIVFPILSVRLLCSSASRSYWIWRGKLRIWIDTLDAVTFKRFVDK